jgi:arylsulfatase A-like enzyme
LINHNGELRRHTQDVFGPDVFNDYVLTYIEKHRDQPFFIYYPMVLAHDPWVTTPDMTDASATDHAKFAAMMSYMDKLVGKVRRKIEEVGLEERTVIFFMGDNGTGRAITSRQNGRDVRGAKGRTIEAGSRVPFIAWGPAVVQPGGVSGSLVNFNDLFPTLAELAGVPLPADYPGDGASLAPVLRGEGELPRDNLFIHYEPMWPTGRPARYAFDRRYKLYQGGDFFDMQDDPLEQHPLEPAALYGGAKDAYKALAERIALMPGELHSNRRWIPRQFYYATAAVTLGVILLSWLVLRPLLRRRGQRL